MLIDIQSPSSCISEVTHETANAIPISCSQNDFEHICNFSVGVSLKGKNNSATKHINKALEVINSGYKTIDDIPYEGFTDKLAGQIGMYMATMATNYMKPEGKKISCLTAMSYMSSFKTHFTTKFR